MARVGVLQKILGTGGEIPQRDPNGQSLTKEFPADEALRRSQIIAYYDPPGPAPNTNQQLWGEAVLLPMVRYCPGKKKRLSPF